MANEPRTSNGQTACCLALTLSLLAGMASVALPSVRAAWEAPEGAPYTAEERELLSTTAQRDSLVFKDGVLAWVERPHVQDAPYKGYGAENFQGRLAFLDTRSGSSGNLQDGNGTPIDHAEPARAPAVSGSHVAWIHDEPYRTPEGGLAHRPVVYALSLQALVPIRFEEGVGGHITPPHLTGYTLTWTSMTFWNSSFSVIHRADLANGTVDSWRFPVEGWVVGAWPLGNATLVHLETGREDRPGGLYLWEPTGMAELLTVEPALSGFPGIVEGHSPGIVEGHRVFWTQYREGDGRGTSIYSFDIASRKETRVTMSPGREHSPTASGDLLAWADVRREEMCGDHNCPARYNLYFGNMTTRNEYKLEGSWNFTAGPALDGRQLTYGDAQGRLRLATLPGPDSLLVASTKATVQLTSPERNETNASSHASLEINLAAPGSVLQRWDLDLDGVFEVEGSLRIPLASDNSSSIRGAFGYVMDGDGRTAAMSVDVQLELRNAFQAQAIEAAAVQAVRDAAAIVDAVAANVTAQEETAPNATAQNEPTLQPPAQTLPAATPGTPQALSQETTLASEAAGLAPPAPQSAAETPPPESLDAFASPSVSPVVLGAGVGFSGAGAALLGVRPQWLRRLLPVALFSRLDSARALDHPVHGELAALIEANPGMHYQELVRRIGRGRGIVEHHLASLCRAGVVLQRSQGRYTCYFHRDVRLDPRLLDSYGLLKAQGARGVLAALSGSSGRSRKDLAGDLGLSPTTISYHLQRLAEGGLLEGRRLGGRTHYTVTPIGRLALRS